MEGTLTVGVVRVQNDPPQKKYIYKKNTANIFTYFLYANIESHNSYSLLLSQVSLYKIGTL